MMNENTSSKKPSSNKTRGYYVVARITDKHFLASLCLCLESILACDGHHSIVVIDNNSPYQFTETELPDDKGQITVWRNDQYPRAGFTVPYWYNHHLGHFDQYMVLHDTMRLKKPIPEEVWNQNFTFLWYADHSVRSKLVHGSCLERLLPFLTEDYRDELWNIYLNQAQDCVDNCSCYDCRNRYPLKGNNDLEKFWTVCFGCCLIVQESFMTELFNKYGLDNIYKRITNKTWMEACERLWPMLIFHHTGKTGYSQNLNGNIEDHPKKTNIKSANVINLNQLFQQYKDYDSYCLKVWGYRF